MTSLAYVAERIAKIPEQEFRETCAVIVKEVASRFRRQNNAMWTYQTFARWAQRDPTDLVLHQSVKFLATQGEVRVLEMHFLYFDPSKPDDIGEPVADDEVAAAYKHGFFVSPESGAEVRNFEEFLLPYFEPVAGLDP